MQMDDGQVFDPHHGGDANRRESPTSPGIGKKSPGSPHAERARKLALELLQKAQELAPYADTVAGYLRDQPDALTADVLRLLNRVKAGT